MDEYEYYLEQRYFTAGRIEVRILNAAQARELGFTDGFKARHKGYTTYVDGFLSYEAAMAHIEDLSGPVEVVTNGA